MEKILVTNDTGRIWLDVDADIIQQDHLGICLERIVIKELVETRKKRDDLQGMAIRTLQIKLIVD